MGIFLDLRGTVRPGPRGPLRWLEATTTWLSARAPGLLRGVRPDGGSGLLLRLHPAAPGVSLALEPVRGRRDQARVRLRAQTEAVGPGYHRQLCGLAHALAGERGVRWTTGACRDDAGFFLGGGEEELQHTFDEDLAREAAAALARIHAGEAEVGLHLPPGLAFPLTGAAATPLGPRPLAWLEAVAADGALGRDVYPWAALEPGPEEALGRAMCLIWMERRPRPPLNEAEMAVDLEIATLLEGQAAPQPDTTGMGYRHGPVRVSLPGGWSIEIPGTFADDVEEDGTWVAWDEGHSLWASVLGPQGGQTGTAPLPSEGGPELELVEEDGEEGEPTRRFFRLSGRVAAADSLLVLTLCFTDPAEREPALRIWGSVRPGGVTAPRSG